MEPTATPPAPADEAALARVREVGQRILHECGKRIVGQREVLEQLLIALLARGHCLLVGVPGLAKTLMIRTLAETMHLSFSRIQFTPDLMPSDITGTEVIQEDRTSGQRVFRFVQGPIFANVILADEINRTPPKTQSALLEAMQEVQVTVAGTRHPLPMPFFVLATQNPIEQEGTYSLPEAALDRFMLNLRVDYPAEDEECRIVEATAARRAALIQPVVTGEELLGLQQIVDEVPVAPFVIRYATRLCRLSRRDTPEAPDFVREYVTWGAGPRASQSLVLAAKARAVLHGRPFVSTDDIRAVAGPVLRHRILTNYNAQSAGVSPDQIVRRLIEIVPRDPAEAQYAAR
jgi:MoxR-like ATPase